MRMRPGSRVAAILFAGFAYVAGSHWLMTRTPASAWDVVGVLGPMLVAVGLSAWRGGQRGLCAAAVLATAGLCAQALVGAHADAGYATGRALISAQHLYLAQHVGVNLSLALVFGSTLRSGRTPLISKLASRLHQGLTPAMALYTRTVTLAWTLFFAAMAIVSLGLYARARFDTWALFANVLTPLAVAAMFVGEYLLRYRLHPEFERASIADAIRAYRQGSGDAAVAPQQGPAA